MAHVAVQCVVSGTKPHQKLVLLPGQHQTQAFSSSSSSVFPAIPLGVTILGEIFFICDHFLIQPYR